MEYKRLVSCYEDALNFSSIVTKTDLKGVITHANDNFCKISGYSREELIGKPHNIVRHPDESSDTFKDMWRTIQNKQPWKGNLKNRHKSGTTYYVQASVIPLLDESNEIVEYISIRHDISHLTFLTNNLEKHIALEIEENKNKESELIKQLSQFLDGTPNSIIVLWDERVEFVNKSFLRLLEKDKKPILNKKYDFSKLLIKSKGFVHNPDDFILHKFNKIAIKTKHGRNMFNLYYEEFHGLNNKLLKMYTLNNITASEYQKLKIDLYNRQLQEYYIRTKSPRCSKEIVKLDNREVRRLNDVEKSLLKRNHADNAISSHEYSHEIDEYVLIEIQELGDIEDEIYNLIHELEVKNISSFSEVVHRLLKFSSVLNNLSEFKELSFSISSLSDMLNEQNISTLDETTYKKTLLYLSNIVLDLSSWRNIVFIEQSANDIHYMDGSLFSSILQLELLLNSDKKHDEEEDDFEMF